MIFKEHIKDVGFRPFFSGSELRDLGINPKSTGKGFLYTWNANGSLRSVTDLKGVTYRFRYDAFGRRLEKRRMASTFRFVWDGNVLLHETFKKDNSEHTELTTWVFEGFVPTAKLVNGKAYSIISDHLGTPILAIDSEGNEVWNRQLDIYGRVKREIKASSLGEDVRPFIPFLYQGQYYDFETNLAYNRFRYYSPETGAYISQDPIGLAGGANLYSYVLDVNVWLDLFGLSTVYLRDNEIYVGKAKQNAKTRYKSDKNNTATDIFFIEENDKIFEGELNKDKPKGKGKVTHTDVAQGVEQIVFERLKESPFVDEKNKITNQNSPVDMNKKDKAVRREYGEAWLKSKYGDDYEKIIDDKINNHYGKNGKGAGCIKK